MPTPSVPPACNLPVSEPATCQAAADVDLVADVPNVSEVLWQSFRHFLHLDESNAAVHTAPVRYSPLTFRLAEALVGCFEPLDNGPKDAAVRRVMDDRGAYEEDLGR